MEIIQHNNKAQFLAFVPKIKGSIQEWRLVNISFGKGVEGSIFYIAKKLWSFMHDSEGQIFICSSGELLALARTGTDLDVSALKKNIQGCFPEYECIIDVVETTK